MFSQTISRELGNGWWKPKSFNSGSKVKKVQLFGALEFVCLSPLIGFQSYHLRPFADLLISRCWENCYDVRIPTEWLTQACHRICFTLPLLTSFRSVAVNHVEEGTRGIKVGIAYIYCDYKDPKTHSEFELISSLTRQLAEQIDTLPAEVKLFHVENIRKNRNPTDNERFSLVNSISHFFETIYVFIDALVIRSSYFFWSPWQF